MGSGSAGEMRMALSYKHNYVLSLTVGVGLERGRVREGVSWGRGGVSKIATGDRHALSCILYLFPFTPVASLLLSLQTTGHFRRNQAR